MANKVWFSYWVFLKINEFKQETKSKKMTPNRKWVDFGCGLRAQLLNYYMCLIRQEHSSNDSSGSFPWSYQLLIFRLSGKNTVCKVLNRRLDDQWHGRKDNNICKHDKSYLVGSVNTKTLALYVYFLSTRLM